MVKSDITFNGKGHPVKNKFKKHLAEIKALRRSYPSDIGDELDTLGHKIPNYLKSEISATIRHRQTELPNKTRVPLMIDGNIPMGIAKSNMTKRMRKRINEQLQRGERQSRNGELTFEMERFLRRHEISIEVVPQKWKRIEAF